MDTDFKDSRYCHDFHVDDVSSEVQMDVVAHEVRRHFALLDGAPAHMYVEQQWCAPAHGMLILCMRCRQCPSQQLPLCVAER